MKMILWVEDQKSVVTNLLGTPPNKEQTTSDWLLETHHIHWVDNVDDALTAMQSSAVEYDFFLLDVALPAFGNIDDLSEVKHKPTLTSFVSTDGWMPSNHDAENDEEFDSVIAYYNDHSIMNAGMHLYLHLIHTKMISTDKIRVYSGHVSHIESFKVKLEEKGIPPIRDKFIFNKATDGDLNVKEWILNTVTDKNRILRHAMVAGCNEVLSGAWKARPLFYKKNSVEVDPKKNLYHTKLIRNTVNTMGSAYGDSNAYRSILMMILTSECQEQLSESRGDRKLDDDFERLAGILVRIRNMFVHNANIHPWCFDYKFVAFTFMIYLRSRYMLDLKALEYEKVLISLFNSRNLNRLDECFEKLDWALSRRCRSLQVSRNYYQGLRDHAKWAGKKYTYQSLLADYRFTQLRFDSQQCKPICCYRLFLLNFLRYERDDVDEPKAEFFEEQTREHHYGKWIIHTIKYQNKIEFKDVWYDDFFKAFYTEAFKE